SAGDLNVFVENMTRMLTEEEAAFRASRGGVADIGTPAAQISPLQGDADKLAEQLHRELEGLTGSKEAMDNYRFALAGVSAAKLNEIENLERSIELYKLSKQAMEETRSPLEKFRQETEKLFEAQAFGAISTDLLARRLGQMYDAEDKRDSEHRSAGAAAYGSREAYSTINQFQYGNKQENIQQRIERINQRMLDEQQRIERNTDEMKEL